MPREPNQPAFSDVVISDEELENELRIVLENEPTVEDILRGKARRAAVKRAREILLLRHRDECYAARAEAEWLRVGDTALIAPVLAGPAPAQARGPVADRRGRRAKPRGAEARRGLAPLAGRRRRGAGTGGRPGAPREPRRPVVAWRLGAKRRRRGRRFAPRQGGRQDVGSFRPAT